MTRRALLALFAFLFGKRMPAYPNQYDATVLPFSHSGTLDGGDSNQVGQPENINGSYPEDQFFVSLTPGLQLQIDVTFASDAYGYNLVIFYPSAFDHWYGWYIVSPSLVPTGTQRDYFRWTVPGADPQTRISIFIESGSAVVDYTIRISEVGTDTGGGSGAGYGAF